MPIPSINISEFDYELPENFIAKYPLNQRDKSNLLIYDEAPIRHAPFSTLNKHLPPNSLLVFNNTKVVRARLKFYKSTGAKIEVFCLEPYNIFNTTLAFQQLRQVEWLCLVGNLKKWKTGLISASIKTKYGEIILDAELTGKINHTQIVKFSWNHDKLTFTDILEGMGQVPIPPYLNRASELIDEERYQTIYSKINGSVAAPTAGFHFSDETIMKLQQEGHKILELTLHIGIGTFQPIKSTMINEHNMHSEKFEITKKALNAILMHQGPIIAVGTTSVRTLESLYISGVLLSKKLKANKIKQDYGFNIKSDITFKQSLQEIINHLASFDAETFYSSTALMIAPDYHFKAINGLITNFHQPKSTLLLLIAALIGEQWKAVYEYALSKGFRFLSYGDSSLLLPAALTR